MDVNQRISDAADRLTKSERRVAELVLSRPQAVGFGTVAELARSAGSGSATVVRLATKLGFDGFTGLQAAVRAELANQLRPAAERIKEPVGDGLLHRQAAAESNNLLVSMDRVVDADLRAATELLADADRQVVILSGDASRGVALQCHLELDALRPGVELAVGNAVQVQRQVALRRPGDVVVAIDLRRYDRWLVDVLPLARERGVRLIALTDSRLSPLAHDAAAVFVVDAASTGPFDSHVATLAVLNLLVAGTADRLRSTAEGRLAAAERAWSASGALVDAE